MDYKLSVIVPVYNVECYIEKCLHSLFRQTLSEIEYIFVNDCSTDASVAVIERVLELYPDRKPHAIIVNHDVNRGVAAARTTGMKMMRGEYMAHCDGDDWLDVDAYKHMYEAAVSADADMVTCRYLNAPDASKPEGACFTGSAIDCLRSASYSYGLWDKLIRSSIIKDNDIYPFEGINYNEDLNVIVRALCFSHNVVGLEQPLYHHLVGREGSICNSNYKSNLITQSVPSMERLDSFLDDFGRKYQRSEISSRLTVPLKFWMKSGLYVSGDLAAWRILWPECHSYMFKVKSLTLKEKALMFFRALQH